MDRGRAQFTFTKGRFQLLTNLTNEGTECYRNGESGNEELNLSNWFQNLEKRELLASFLSDTGVLIVSGTGGNDTIRVQGFAPTLPISVFGNSEPVDNYTFADVQSLRIFAQGGDDKLFGNAGNNTLHGG